MLLLSVVRCPHAEDFDWQNQSGRFVRYHTYGAAVVQVEVDCLTGNYTVLIYYGQWPEEFGPQRVKNRTRVSTKPTYKIMLLAAHISGAKGQCF